jgi:hypothetical protein
MGGSTSFTLLYSERHCRGALHLLQITAASTKGSNIVHLLYNIKYYRHCRGIWFLPLNKKWGQHWPQHQNVQCLLLCCTFHPWSLSPETVSVIESLPPPPQKKNPTIPTYIILIKALLLKDFNVSSLKKILEFNRAIAAVKMLIKH